MGRLKYKHLLRKWQELLMVLAIVILGIIIYARFSQTTLPSARELEEYLASDSLKVNSEVVSDFQHVYYVFNGVKIFITKGESNNYNPVSSGQFIAWLSVDYGSNQRLVSVYDVLSRTTTQVTYHGSAARLAMSSKGLVWQDESQGVTQIMYYDGSRTEQISRDYSSLRPQINGHLIAYAQQLSNNKWRVMEYDINAKKTRVFSTGDHYHAWPKYIDGKLYDDRP